MNASQTPELSRGFMGCESGFQPLKSPTTEMRSAFGAHTAKYVPSPAVQLGEVRAELLEQPHVLALVEQMQIERRQQLFFLGGDGWHSERSPCCVG